MNYELLIIFIVLNVLNVIIQTVKSLATVKCGKVVASIVNALAYGLYTIVVVYTMCDLDLYLKALIVAICNLIGVFLVKLFEEKIRKDRLWKVEATFNKKDIANENIILDFRHSVPLNYIDINEYYIVNFYCATQSDSIKAKAFIDMYNGKYFVSESKIL